MAARRPRRAVLSGWTIFFGLLALYMLLLVWLVRTGRMEKYNLSLLLGFILMLRTQRGRGLLASAARPTRFWNVFADIGIVVTFLGMALMTLVMLLLLPIVLNPSSGIAPLAASEILVIPGVNPFVPLWYGLIALIVTLVVHEGGHGVLAIANKMRVKSVGLLFAIVPVGAFVEPDEEDLTESSRRNRLRVYAAGPAVNIAFAVITVAIFAVMIGAAAPIQGAGLAGVEADSAAAMAGIEPGDILTSADGQPIEAWPDLTAALGEASPGDPVEFGRYQQAAVTATLGDRWSALAQSEQQAILESTEWGRAYCDAVVEEGVHGGPCAERLQAMPFLGVRPAPDVHGVLSHPFGDNGRNFLAFMSLPIGEVRGAPWLSTYMPTFMEAPWSADLYWPIATTFFFVFWINLMVGLTNILPMLPLDGGHMFRDGMGGVMGRLRPKMDAETRDKVVGRMAGIVSFVILGAFLLQIFGPRLAQAFA